MNACETFYEPSKSVLQMVKMLKNACECLCRSYECVANDMRTQNRGTNLHNTHWGVSPCLISARSCPISLFSFKFVLIVYIRPAFCGNVNTNASESLQMSYNHYKCLAINKNGLRLLTNMLRICFSCEL